MIPETAIAVELWHLAAMVGALLLLLALFFVALAYTLRAMIRTALADLLGEVEEKVAGAEAIADAAHAEYAAARTRIEKVEAAQVADRTRVDGIAADVGLLKRHTGLVKA